MKNEKVLVVKKESLYKRFDLKNNELTVLNSDRIVRYIAKNQEYIDREFVEYDSRYKQIIPYVMTTFKGDFLLTKRYSAQTESRLHDKLSLGIGGHLNPVDGKSKSEVITAGLKREFNEEICLGQEEYTPQLIGIINDDSTNVGLHHLGIFYVIEALENSFSILEPNKMDAAWATISQLKKQYMYMESWSQIIYKHYILNLH